jgi:hypothetical protein
VMIIGIMPHELESLHLHVVKESDHVDLLVSTDAKNAKRRP